MIAAAHRKKTGLVRIIFLALMAFLLAAPMAASAQALPDLSSQSQAPATEASTEDMKALLKTLEDPAERDKLAAQLRAMIAVREQQEAPGKGARLFDALSGGVETATEHIAEASQALANVPAVAEWVQRQVTDPAARDAILALAVKLAFDIGLAAFAAFASAYFLSKVKIRVERTAPEGMLLRWLMRLVHALLDFAPVAIFAAVAYIILPFTNPDATARAVTIAIVNAVVLLRAVMVLAGLVLVPDASVLRLVPVGTETAHYLYIWVRRIAATGIYGYFAAQAALVLGLHERGYHAVLNVLALIIAIMLVILILQSRREVGSWIRGSDLEPLTKRPGALAGLRSLLGDIWFVLAILYIAALYFVYALRLPGGFEFVLTAGVLTIVIILAAQLIYTLLSRAMDSGFSINDDLRRRFPTIEQRANRYLPVFEVAAKIIIFGAATLLLLQVWGLDSISWLTSGIGQEITLTAAGIVVVLAVAAAIWEAGTIYMESYLSRSEDTFESAEQRARMQTLLPLFRKIFLMVLVAIVGITILAQLGLNIAPLLAGAGIIGLAIGFGAQKVVQDVFNGMFIFLEAAVAIGDWVEMGGHTGMVEAMSIRSIRLRDLEGNVHTLPFSAVTTVMNQTKGFSYHLFDIGVGYGEKVDDVIKVLKDVGAEMREDKKFGRDIIEDLDMLGLDKFGDSAIVIRGRIKVRPGAQWRVGREFNRRVKNRFDELGIEIPFPQRTLHFRMPPRELLEPEPGESDARDGDRP